MSKQVKEVVESLLKQGCKRVDNLVIRNVVITPMENYTRVTLVLNNAIKGFTFDMETGEYTDSNVNLIFTSNFSIAALLKESDDTAFAANHLVENPTAMEVILSRAKIDVIQQRINAGDTYENPFSDNATPQIYDHDIYVNHIVAINLSDFGKRNLDVLAMKMLKCD